MTSGWRRATKASKSPLTGSQEERVDDGALTSQVGVGCGDIGTFDPAPRPARQLPGRGRGSTHHRGDLLEWQVEHVVENEGKALCRGQRTEYDLERKADRVGEQRFVLGLKGSLGADDRIGEMHLQ